MRTIRFSLRGLLAAFVFVGFGVAALLGGTAVWAQAAVGVMLLGLAAVVLGAIYLRGPSRAFYVGAAVFGWGYLATWGLVIPWMQTTDMYVNSNSSRPHLVTETALDWMAGIVEREVQVVASSDGAYPEIPQRARAIELARTADGDTPMYAAANNASDYGITVPGVYPITPGTPLAYVSPVRAHFKTTGHALLTLCLALLEGWLGRWFCLSAR